MAFHKNMSNKVAFLSWKVCESCKIFDWNLFIVLLSMINQHWFKKWQGADLAPGHFLEQWWQKPMLPGVNFRCLWVNLRKWFAMYNIHILPVWLISLSVIMILNARQLNAPLAVTFFWECIYLFWPVGGFMDYRIVIIPHHHSIQSPNDIDLRSFSIDSCSEQSLNDPHRLGDSNSAWNWSFLP